jgi:formylglycine-generating enzyme required for sulfatase activity
LKWCNARSEKDGKTPCYTISGKIYKSGQYMPDCDFSANGYRLPTVMEWEYAARGGLSGKRFPWGDTITHRQANYVSGGNVEYDKSLTDGFHPDYYQDSDDDDWFYTSPAGSFAPNDYGLFDMAGNVKEWCWDSTAERCRDVRGGSWWDPADDVRCGYTNWGEPAEGYLDSGFRSVCRP